MSCEWRKGYMGVEEKLSGNGGGELGEMSCEWRKGDLWVEETSENGGVELGGMSCEWRKGYMGREKLSKKGGEHSPILWRSIGRFLLTVITSALLWGCATHIAHFTVQDGWDPVFLAWLCSVTSALAPVLCRIVLWGCGEQSTSWKALGPHKVTPVLAIKRIFPVCSCSLLALSLYLLALQSLCTTEVTALYSCNKALCYLLSWTILREQFMGVRVVAVICCLAGVVMMSYTESPNVEAPIGRILTLSAAALTAMNEVLFRLLLGRLDCHETATFLGLCGICSSLLLWWVPLLVYLKQKKEESGMLVVPSIEYLCVTIFIFFLFQLFEKIGSHFLSVSGVSLGVFLSVAVVRAMDKQWEFPSGGHVMAISAIGIGFSLLIIPEDWREHLGLAPNEQGRQEDTPSEDRSRGSILAI
ncbi:solute carrier family 35 member F3-like [Pseudophryne corroboree]|uniref:solute carrier family 35 member F3-like n=1 Tax=Pseudophryne corroboree TaxID=495146 RepID=UPI00308134E2